MTKTIDPHDLRTAGYVQEANRLFFHPLGLALSVAYTTGHDGDTPGAVLQVQDHRDDPEGVVFRDLTSHQQRAKAERVAREAESKRDTRLARIGATGTALPTMLKAWAVQAIGTKLDAEES